MDKRINQFLQEYSSSPIEIDRLLISLFLCRNGLTLVNNRLIESYRITDIDSDWGQLREILKLKDSLTFEELIEFFEFVISPSEKVVNGAVYTPLYIREYIVSRGIELYQGDIGTVKAADISCGCGGFLLTLAEKIKIKANRTYAEIFRQNLYGVDIAEYSIQRTKLLLSLFAISNDEDEEEFEFNLFTGNSLIFDWNEQCPEINDNFGFDLIVGNPPYVCSRNMDDDTRAQIQNWEVSRAGHPDLYIPFFQIGLENLNPNGILAYITVNTFIKSINGRSLRAYFARQDIHLTLLNFGGEQVFKDRNTYTCICFLKHGNGEINYLRTSTQTLNEIDLANLHRFQYEELNHHDGWSLVNGQELVNFIRIVENTGVPFKDIYDTKNGIATLMNEVYKFRPVYSDLLYYYLDNDGILYPIEISICKRIINANKVKAVTDIDRLIEQIIFPYTSEREIISEDTMLNSYPMAYRYLQTKKNILATRDKGKRIYETWYAYGRRQSMDINAYKLFFPHICARPNFVICDEMDLLFYNGMAIVSDRLDDLLIIKKLLESELFYRYIRNSTKDYSSGFISMSRNYLKNFGVYQFSDQQKREFLMTTDVEAYLERLYNE